MSVLTFQVIQLVIRRKTVKYAKAFVNMMDPLKFVDTCALKWRRYEFSDISGHTVVISRKTVKYRLKCEDMNRSYS